MKSIFRFKLSENIDTLQHIRYKQYETKKEKYMNYIESNIFTNYKCLKLLAINATKNIFFV